MTRTGALIKYWLPALVWMVVIFCASSDSQSVHRSSRIIEPILRWFKPDMSQPTVDRLVTIIRKCAHVTEYAIFSVLLWRARHGTSARPRGWTAAHAIFAFIVATLYSASDEIHQAFVPNRGPSFKDVCLDAAGAALGLLVTWYFVRRKNRRVT